MCAGAIYWTGIGRVMFALSETGLMKYTGSHKENPTLDLPCPRYSRVGSGRLPSQGR